MLYNICYNPLYYYIIRAEQWGYKFAVFVFNDELRTDRINSKYTISAEYSVNT